MAIRIKNLDLATDGMKRATTVNLGDVTAVGNNPRHVFIAPVDCVVNTVDFYTNQTALQSASNVSSCNFLITLNQNGSSVQTRGNSGTAVGAHTLSASSQYRLTPSAANSMSVGSMIQAVINLCGSCVLSAVTCVVTYTPLTHRQTR